MAPYLPHLLHRRRVAQRASTRSICALFFIGVLTAASPIYAQDVAWSGFGTLGYAQSDRDYAYQRFINSAGTFERDSVLAIQADTRLGPRWSATLQLKLAPSLKAEARWAVTPAWAFLAWRPNDDWLLRAGRLRVPLYLYSEAMDVGQAHDMARLPTEMYSIAPSDNFDGLSANRSWALGDGDLSVDAYAGQGDVTARVWFRDGLAPMEAAGAKFFDVNVKLAGLALTLKQPGRQLRASLHHTSTSQSNGNTIPVDIPYVSLAPGVGYYRVSNDLPGGVDMTSRLSISNVIFTLGAEQTLGQGWRLAAEYAVNRQLQTDFGSDTRGGYLALFKQIDKITPYVSVSALKSRRPALDWYQRLTSNPLPELMPGAAQINAAQRMVAESMWVADQRTLALGASYAVSPGGKIKAEWQRTRIGQVTRLVDALPGSTPHDTHVDVLSVNYNFAF